jgi:opacity protein-like surface antigen
VKRTLVVSLLSLIIGSPAEAKKPNVAVLDLQAQGVPEENAATLTGVLLSGLSEGGGIDLLGKSDLGKMLTLEETKILVGCPPEDPDCVVQHGASLGNAILVWGTVGKVGDRVVISVAAVDVQAGTTVGRGSRSVDVEDGEEMIQATRELAEEIRLALGLKPKPKWQPIMAASLRVGGILSGYLGGNGSLNTWLTAFEAETNFFILQQLIAYVQIGLTVGAGEDDQDRNYDAYFVPAVIGLKYRWIRPWVTPYAGLGVGLEFLDLNNQGGAFSLHVMVGMEINPWERLGFCVEGGFKFSEYFDTKDFTQLGGKVHVGVIYRF